MKNKSAVFVVCCASAAAAVCQGRAPGTSPAGEPLRLVREISDPHTGVHWLLMRNPKNPAGPGVFLTAGQVADDRNAVALPARQPLFPIVRTGDRLTLTEDTQFMRARLEATALSPAGTGARLQVRLKIGGKLAWAVAVAPGLAVWAEKGGISR